MTDGPINGRTLLAWGIEQGPWFRGAIEAAERVRLAGGDEVAMRAAAEATRPLPPATLPLRRSDELACRMNIAPESPDEVANVAAVVAHMNELMRVPTIVAGAVMPDACPSGSAPGTVPVGGVAAAREAIHPGMHSADICCSMAVSFLGSTDPARVLEAGVRLTHFGPGGRPEGARVAPPDAVMAAVAENPFLRRLTGTALAHFATQGDGNHFFYVGRLASTGETALVTHHGSRGLGAQLYKVGMLAAERHRSLLSPETPAHNAWIPSETREGEDYWAALQAVRGWTKASHFAIHDLVAGALGERITDRFWNEHNFVFRRADGLFYHAKGATPAFPGWAADATGMTLIPLNMAQPILLARGLDAENGLGFAPHGAGRNLSRTAYMRLHAGKTAAEMVAEQAPGVDVRFYSGTPDVSELPLAYKDAATVRAQIRRYGLAEIVDTIEPAGCIMAGHVDWQRRPKKSAAGTAPEALPQGDR